MTRSSECRFAHLHNHIDCSMLRPTFQNYPNLRLKSPKTRSACGNTTLVHAPLGNVGCIESCAACAALDAFSGCLILWKIFLLQFCRCFDKQEHLSRAEEQRLNHGMQGWRAQDARKCPKEQSCFPACKTEGSSHAAHGVLLEIHTLMHIRRSRLDFYRILPASGHHGKHLTTCSTTAWQDA